MQMSLGTRTRPSPSHAFLGKRQPLAEADPEFPIGGGAGHTGAPKYDFAKNSKTLHEIENILGRGRAPPPRSRNQDVFTPSIGVDFRL